METFIIGAYIKGRTMKVETTWTVKAESKDAALEQVKEAILREGFEYEGENYCDWLG